MIEITIEGDPAREILSGVSALFNRSAMFKYGRRVRKNTRRRATEEIDPDGRSWVPLSAAYAARKKGPGILRETGDLMGTIQVNARKGQAEVGTELIRGVYHQQQGGPTGGRLPQRQWLGVTDDDLTEIGSVAERIWEAHFA